jgi:UDP-N-acetyl-D-glucosamine dehydrogenase
MIKSRLKQLTLVSKRIKSRDYSVCIIGLGYVGLPLAMEFSEAGFSVLGLDIDKDKISKLKRAHNYIKHIDNNRLRKMVRSYQFIASSDFSIAKNADAFIICVPTPLTNKKIPNIGHIKKAIAYIKPFLKKGNLISLESTTYPGTTREIIAKQLEELGFIVGKNIFLTFAPEREDPANKHYSLSNIPKVIGADDDASMFLAKKLYGTIVSSIVPVSSSKCAEAVKLTENIFRAVNVALVNELKLVFDKMNIDIWEVIEAAKTKPFGYMPFYPGPGYGGHCIPIDPYFLSWKAKEHKVNTHLIDLAGEINNSMPRYVIGKTQSSLKKRGITVKGAKVLIVGIAYKKDIDDVRESPSLRLMKMFIKKGALVDYHDPLIPIIGNNEEYSTIAGARSINLNKKELLKYDVVIISTNHSYIDYNKIMQNAKIIVDTRNAYSGLKSDNIIKA